MEKYSGIDREKLSDKNEEIMQFPSESLAKSFEKEVKGFAKELDDDRWKKCKVVRDGKSVTVSNVPTLNWHHVYDVADDHHREY